MPSADIELVRGAYEALNHGDPDPLAALFTPDSTRSPTSATGTE